MLIRKRQSKVLSVLMSFFMVLGLIVLPNVKAFAAENLITNGDFEDASDTKWTPRGGNQLTYTTDEFHGGSHSLKVSGRTKTWEGPTTDMTATLAKGKTYHISVWVKYNDGPATKQFNLQFETTTSGTVEYPAVGNAVANKGEWTLIEGDYTIKDDANLTKYALYVETPWVADDQVTADDTMDFFIDDLTIADPTAAPAAETAPAPAAAPAATDNPKTGDAGSSLYFVAILAAVCGIFAVSRKRVRA